MSSNAPGIPRAFVATARPLRTRAGDVEAQLMAGTLTESRFFDASGANDYRSLSGLLVTFRPRVDSGLTLGLARAVVAPVSGAAGSLGHALDVLTRWEPLARATDTLADGRVAQRADQLLSLFARWAFPGAGFEAYGEWARMELPRSLREALVAPQSTQGYTLGLQWARPALARAHVVRLQGEVTYLEQSVVFTDRPPPDFYTGRATAQGFTQRGQVVGAAIGPGASSQRVGADYVAPRWQAGVFAGRIRWENDALYRQEPLRATRHDVTIYSGARGAWRSRWTDVSGELTVGRRLNYLFQSDSYNPGENAESVDVQNVTLVLGFTPR
jgi:hypothetical protein